MQPIQKDVQPQEVKNRLKNCKEIAKVGKGFIRKILRTFEFMKQQTHETCVHQFREEQCPLDDLTSPIVSRDQVFKVFCKMNDSQEGHGILSEDEVRERYPREYYSLKCEVNKSISERFDAFCKTHGLFYKRDDETGKFIWAEYETKENVKRVFCPSLTVPSPFSVYYSQRLSKLQLKQLILYHFLHPDENGVISMICEKEVAKLLGCHVKSVKANNRFFEEIGLIFYSKSDNGRINVWLRDYKTYHLSKEQGGEGYIHMSKELLSILLCIEDVNVLRMEIQKVMKYDSDTIKYINKTDDHFSRTALSTLTYDELKKVVPFHMRSQRQLKKIASRSTEAFDTTVEDSSIVFKLKERYNGKIIKREQKAKRYEELRTYLLSFYPTETIIEIKQIEDLVQMSFEYGLDPVKNAIKEAANRYEFLDQSIFNLGGMIRTIIKTSYLKNLA